MFLRHALGLSLLVGTLGCAATVKLRSGKQVKGDIVRGDAQHVYMKLRRVETLDVFDSNPELRPANPDKPGKLYMIRRAAIERVSHPGFAAGLTGSILTGLGLPLIVWGIAETGSCTGDLCGIHHLWTTFPGVILSLAGLATMIPGWVMYADSKSAMESDVVARGPKIQVVPIAAPVAGKVHVGMAAQGSW